MPWNEITKTQFARPRARFESDLTDEKWILVEPCLPPPARRGRPRKTDLREVSDAIQHMPGTGCQWRALPYCFPPSATVRQYFHLWRRDGIFARMMDRLRALGRELAGRSSTPTAAAINPQSAETTESGGPSGCDAGKKAEGRKRHLVVDVVGFPIEIAVHEASVQDRDGAPAVILGMLETAPHAAKLWADGGYQGRSRRPRSRISGSDPSLKSSTNPRISKQLYRRWIVERTFAWMSRCRRRAKDYERSLENSVAWAQLAACRFMMRRIARAVKC